MGEVPNTVDSMRIGSPPTIPTKYFKSNYGNKKLRRNKSYVLGEFLPFFDLF